jgi:hypothetical protein
MVSQQKIKSLCGFRNLDDIHSVDDIPKSGQAECSDSRMQSLITSVTIN